VIQSKNKPSGHVLYTLQRCQSGCDVNAWTSLAKDVADFGLLSRFKRTIRRVDFTSFLQCVFGVLLFSVSVYLSPSGYILVLRGVHSDSNKLNWTEICQSSSVHFVALYTPAFIYRAIVSTVSVWLFWTAALLLYRGVIICISSGELNNDAAAAAANDNATDWIQHIPRGRTIRPTPRLAHWQSPIGYAAVGYSPIRNFLFTHASPRLAWRRNLSDIMTSAPCLPSYAGRVWKITAQTAYYVLQLSL